MNDCGNILWSAHQLPWTVTWVINTLLLCEPLCTSLSIMVALHSVTYQPSVWISTICLYVRFCTQAPRTLSFHCVSTCLCYYQRYHNLCIGKNSLLILLRFVLFLALNLMPHLPHCVAVQKSPNPTNLDFFTLQIAKQWDNKYTVLVKLGRYFWYSSQSKFLWWADIWIDHWIMKKQAMQSWQKEFYMTLLIPQNSIPCSFCRKPRTLREQIQS